MKSTFREIVDLWNTHIEFNGWEFKTNKPNVNNITNYKKMNIEDIPFL